VGEPLEPGDFFRFFFFFWVYRKMAKIHHKTNKIKNIYIKKSTGWLVATNQDIKSWFPLFNFLPSKLKVCTLSLFQVSLCVCVCVFSVLSLSLSSWSKISSRVCLVGVFFGWFASTVLCGARVCAQVLVCSPHFIFLFICVSLCVSVFVSLSWIVVEICELNVQSLFCFLLFVS
jgi:hypothetical protein